MTGQARLDEGRSPVTASDIDAQFQGRTRSPVATQNREIRQAVARQVLDDHIARIEGAHWKRIARWKSHHAHVPPLAQGAIGPIANGERGANAAALDVEIDQVLQTVAVHVRQMDLRIGGAVGGEGEMETVHVRVHRHGAQFRPHSVVSMAKIVIKGADQVRLEGKEIALFIEVHVHLAKGRITEGNAPGSATLNARGIGKTQASPAIQARIIGKDLQRLPGKVPFLNPHEIHQAIAVQVGQSRIRIGQTKIGRKRHDGRRTREMKRLCHAGRGGKLAPVQADDLFARKALSGLDEVRQAVAVHVGDLHIAARFPDIQFRRRDAIQLGGRQMDG